MERAGRFQRTPLLSIGPKLRFHSDPSSKTQCPTFPIFHTLAPATSTKRFEHWLDPEHALTPEAPTCSWHWRRASHGPPAFPSW
jgi:hypothetical protein